MTSHTTQLRAIVQRLGELEEENRKLKWSGIAILAALCGVFLMGQAVPSSRVVEAQKFVAQTAVSAQNKD